MSSLYLMWLGASFQSCKALCHISISECRRFFYHVLDVMMDMQDEYIYLPCNIIELNHGWGPLFNHAKLCVVFQFLSAASSSAIFWM
jgi:hypothetical protein